MLSDRKKPHKSSNVKYSTAQRNNCTLTKPGQLFITTTQNGPI